MYVSLFLLINSSHWIWELRQAESIQPVAAMIQHNSPLQQLLN